MNVRQLITALQEHDQGMVVVALNAEWGVLDPVFRVNAIRATKLKLGAGYVEDQQGEAVVVELK